MDSIYEILEETLNYDIVFIIKDFVELLNEKAKLDNCITQIKSINKEHIYLLWAYDKYTNCYQPPSMVSKFILNCNNDKINLNKTPVS